MADLATRFPKRTGQNDGSNIPPTNDKGNFVDTRPPKDTIDKNASAASTIGRLYYPQLDMKYFFQIGIGEYEGWQAIGGGVGTAPRSSTNIDTFITLPMPEQITDQQTASWLDDNLLQEAFKAAGGIVGTVLAARAQSMLSAAGGTLAAAVGASTVGTIAGIATRLGGAAPNQFITILFEGPKYKQHNFTWTFSPQTPEEAESLRSILQVLNNRQAPGISSAGRFLWSFPSIFWLKFCPDVGSFQHTFLYEFKPAVLVNMAIDYAGGHTPSFRRKDGITNNKNPPQSIRLSMQFLEIEYWVNGDYGNETRQGATPNRRIPAIPLRDGLNNT